MRFRKILNIERLELIEERFGISLNGVSAEIKDRDHVDECEFMVRGEIVALTGGSLEHDLILKMSAFDSAGACVAVYEEHIYAESFYGIDVFNFVQYIGSDDVQRVRVFATKA